MISAAKLDNVIELLIDLAKQWRALADAKKDLEFKTAKWANTARNCFPDDRRFISWCKNTLELTDAQAQDLCFLARTFTVAPDAKTWTSLGGVKQIRRVENLPKREQVTILEASKVTGRSIKSIKNERYPEPPRSPTVHRRPNALAPMVPAIASRVPMPPPPMGAQIVSLTHDDACTLVKYLCGLKDVPRSVLKIVAQLSCATGLTS